MVRGGSTKGIKRTKMKDHIAFVERLAREAVLVGGILGEEGDGGGAREAINDESMQLIS